MPIKDGRAATVIQKREAAGEKSETQGDPPRSRAHALAPEWLVEIFRHEKYGD